MLSARRTTAKRKAKVKTGPARNPREPDQLQWVSFAQRVGPRPASASVRAQLTARLLAHHYDRKLAAGAVATPGSALAVHACRLVTVAEREGIARSLRKTLREARKPLTSWTARSWVCRPNVVAASEAIDTITLHLHSPRPVDAIGMTRLRLLLADGTGPLYVAGQGDLTASLRAVLAAL